MGKSQLMLYSASGLKAVPYLSFFLNDGNTLNTGERVGVDCTLGYILLLFVLLIKVL